MAHHGASKNTRLTRLMKKRNAVAPSSSLNIAHHRQTPDVSESNQGVGQDDTGQGDMDEVHPVPPSSSTTTGNPDEDVPKVLATVVNVVNSDIPHSTDLTVPGLTMPSGNAIIEASLTATATAIPAYNSLTADTPSLTVNSLTSATSSTTSSGSTASGTASRPLISSTPPAQTSSAAASASNSSGSSAASSAASNPNSSRVSRPTSKPTTSLPLSITSSNSTSSSDSSSTTSSFTGTTTTTDSDFTSTRWIDGFGGGGRGGSKTGSIGPTSTGTDASPPPAGGPTVPPTTSKIVGGVVGSVAGAVMLVILALFLLKRRTAMRTPHEALPSSETAAAAAAAGGSGGGGAMRGNQPEMTSRFSRDSMLMTSFFTPAFMRRWRDSSHTDSTLVSAGSGERGFQKISGRKIPSVLTSGGDGYGGGYETVSPAGSEPSMTPMIPGSPVNPRSPSMPPPPSIPHGMPLDVSYTQETAEFDDEDTIMHASPARPVVPDIVTVAAGGVPVNLSRSNTYSPGAAAGALSPPAIHQPFQRPDLRTSHSFDGSRGSRFTEDC